MNVDVEQKYFMSFPLHNVDKVAQGLVTLHNSLLMMIFMFSYRHIHFRYLEIYVFLNSFIYIFIFKKNNEFKKFKNIYFVIFQRFQTFFLKIFECAWCHFYDYAFYVSQMIFHAFQFTSIKSFKNNNNNISR